MILRSFWLCLDEDQLDNASCNQDICHDFYLETKCVTLLVERLMTKKVKTEFWKVTVNCCKCPSEPVLVVGGVCNVYVQFDYDEYVQASSLQKKKLALKALMDGLEKTAQIYPEVEIADFHEICKKIEEVNYINSWEWKRAYRRDRKYYAVTRAHVKPEAFEMDIELYSKNGELLCKKNIVQRSTEERLFDRHFGRVKWNSPTEVWLYNKGGKNALTYAKVDFSEYI